MQTIKRDIYVTKNVLQAPIEVTEGTNSIAIEFDVRDYDIPASAAAVAYSLSTSSMEEPNKALADVSGNKITIIPSEAFFLPGQNVMQVRIIDGNSKLISFNIIVKCTGKMRFGDEDEEGQSTLIEQILAKLGEYTGKLDVERKRIDKLDSTKANKTDLTSPYNFKGSCLSSALPASGNTVNDTYYCTDLKYRKTWNGSAWEQSSLNEADYEEELTKTNGEVSSLKEDLCQGTQPFAIIRDEYVNENGTIKQTDQHWDRTDYVEVNDAVIIISKSSSVYNCFFDSSKSFVSSFALVEGENRITVPVNAKYIICSNTSEAIMELIVKLYNSSKIADLENDAKEYDTALKSSKNLIGTIPNKLYPIDYKANENITFSTKGLVEVTKNHAFYFYDENKQYVTDYALYPPLAKRTVSFDKDAKYISLNVEQEVPIQVEYGSKATEYEDYLLKSSGLMAKNDAKEYDTALKSSKNLIGTIPNKLYPIDYKANENITFSTKGLVEVTKNHAFYFYDENKQYVTDYALYPPLAKRTVSFDKDAKYISLNVEQEVPIQVEYGSKATEYEDYLLKSSDLMAKIADWENDASIISLNKQLEPFVIQSTATKARGIGSSLKPLTFIHFSDWHNVPVLWERLCNYMEKYKDYLQFALHTGDYCGGWQGEYTDAYLLKNTTNPILNCVGNHDTYTKEMKKNTQESAYKLLFNHTENWGVTFGSGNNTMYYHKDFPDSEIRLIVLDCYYDIDNQKAWLEERLNEAKALNYAVITAMHEVSKSIVDKIQCTFQTLDNYESAGGNVSAGAFDSIIKTFKDNGGIHIVNLCGHEHDDMFGYTSNGVLNMVVECATTWNGWTGGKRIEGTKTYDCFNVFSVEKDTGIFKVVRIGDNADHYLRAKNMLSYDYVNKKVLYNA